MATTELTSPRIQAPIKSLARTMKALVFHRPGQIEYELFAAQRDGVLKVAIKVGQEVSGRSASSRERESKLLAGADSELC